MADRLGGLLGGLYFFSLVATRFTEFSTERAVLFTLLGLGFLSLSVLAQLRPGAYGRFRAWVILAVKLAAVLLHVDGKRLCHTQVRCRGARMPAALEGVGPLFLEVEGVACLLHPSVKLATGASEPAAFRQPLPRHVPGING